MKKNCIEKTMITYDGYFYISQFNNTKFDMPFFHFHEEYEIYLALSDNVVCFVGNRVYEVNKRDLLIFNNADVHRFYASGNENYCRYIIQFKPKFINDFSTIQTNLLDCFENRNEMFSHLIHLQEDQFDFLLEKFEELDGKSQGEQYGEDLIKKFVFMELLIYINKLYRALGSQPAIPINVMDSRVRNVIHYINENLSENLSLDTLSGILYLSKYHLGDIFKKNTGFTLNEYIILQRVLRAKQLLVDGVSVTMCTEMVGYTSQSHFIRIFKKVTGLSPKRFAKLNMRLFEHNG